ncbi:MAG: hypothetical protein MJZ13_00010 [Bacteroidales bacterium]|nr:hypothetical protein [Bacteroidales bacterium]
MRKQIMFIAVALMGMGSVAMAQCEPTAQDYANFDDTRTLVVLDDNIMSDFNVKIEKLMEKEWKLTKFDFISTKEFDNKRVDPSYSFLTTTTVTYEKDKTKARYTYLSLLMGKEKSKVKNMPDLISIPLAYTSVEDQNYVYKMAAFLRFVQNHVTMIKDNPALLKKIGENPLLYYNKNIKSLANKTLYLVKEELEKSLQNEEAVKAIYPHKFKFVTKAEVTAAIENQEKDVVFVHKVGPEVAKYNTRCFKMVIGADDSEVYYFNYHNIDKKNHDRVLASDFKKMAKQK